VSDRTDAERRELVAQLGEYCAVRGYEMPGTDHMSVSELVQLRESLGLAKPRCRWFALCDQPSIGLQSHAALGYVPVCQKCADKLDLDPDRWPS
jgi:hypothetical protein